jgi:SAM-dependent methyltransferase
MISEAVIGWCSKKPEDVARTAPDENTPGNPLRIPEHEFPDLPALLRDRVVLDFGCGFGHQTAALANSSTYACKAVHGLDSNAATLAAARQRHPGVTFIDHIGDRRYDAVLSLDAMEHYPDPRATLEVMRNALRPGGLLLITFGPPWYAPYGSHMHFFCKIPWLNVFFPERAVMRIRARYRNDGARRYEEVESGLNKMSLRKFEGLIAASGLELVRRRYSAIKRLDFLTRLPFLREFVTIRATALLRLPELA